MVCHGVGKAVEKGLSSIVTKGKGPWSAGENYLEYNYFGKSQQEFTTTHGKRIVDQLPIFGTAHESKTGYQTLTNGIRKQILKDAELVADSRTRVSRAYWHFFRSQVTGKIGASPQLLQFLTNKMENGMIAD